MAGAASRRAEHHPPGSLGRSGIKKDSLDGDQRVVAKDAHQQCGKKSGRAPCPHRTLGKEAHVGR
jgi:hypothetical protein